VGTQVYYRRNWDTSSPKTSANVRVHIPSLPDGIDLSAKVKARSQKEADELVLSSLGGDE